MDKLTVPLQLGEDCYSLRMSKIPAGSFIMGSDSGRGLDDWTDTSMGQFKVIISKYYWMGIYAVTQCQWHSLMGNLPSYFKGSNLPVESITWQDTVEFCNRLNEMILPEIGIPENYLFRLPTEAEWEYACRAGSSKNYQLGNTLADLSKVAWHSDNIPETTFSTQIVGEKSPNGWGLYDMLGNVMEMCFDTPVDYPSGTIQKDWVGKGGSLSDFYNLRGGSIFNDAGIEDNFTCFKRSYTDGEAHRAYGFRLCIGPDIRI